MPCLLNYCGAISHLFYCSPSDVRLALNCLRIESWLYLMLSLRITFSRGHAVSVVVSVHEALTRQSDSAFPITTPSRQTSTLQIV